MIFLSDVRLGQLQRQRGAGAAAVGDDGSAAGSPAVKGEGWQTSKVKGEGLIWASVTLGGPWAIHQGSPDYKIWNHESRQNWGQSTVKPQNGPPNQPTVLHYNMELRA